MARINLTTEKMQRLAQVLAIAGQGADIFMDAKERKDRAHLQELMLRLDIEEKERMAEERKRDHQFRLRQELYARERDATSDERYREQLDHELAREKEMDSRYRTEQADARKTRMRDRERVLKASKFDQDVMVLNALDSLTSSGAETVNAQEAKFESLMLDEFNNWQNPRMAQYFPEQDPVSVVSAMKNALRSGPVSDASELIERAGLDVAPQFKSGLENMLRVRIVEPGNAFAKTVEQDKMFRKKFIGAGMKFAQEHGYSKPPSDGGWGSGGTEYTHTTGQPIAGVTRGPQTHASERPDLRVPWADELAGVAKGFGDAAWQTITGANPFNEESILSDVGMEVERVFGRKPIPEDHWLAPIAKRQ